MWPNRIKERTTVKAADLLDHTGNWRTHPEAQKAGMIGVLEEVGIVDALTVYHSESRGGLVIIDGHLRKSIDPDQEWPIDVLDVDDAEADYILATKDPLAAAAVADREKLGALLHSVQSGEAGVQAMLSELAEREGVVFGGNGKEPEDPGPQIDRSQELAEKWGTALGQIWELGRHKLAVGDCRNRDIINALMGSEKVILSHHDPPYGADVIKIKGASGKGSIGGGNWGPVGEYAPVAGDDVPFDPSHLFGSGETLVLWGANYYADRLPPSSCWLVWDKREGTASNNFADCELAWVNKKGPSRLFAHRWMGMMKASEHGQKRYHPTQKPVALFDWVIEQFTKPGDIVADWYCGAGGQLLAGEKLERLVRACELVPSYAAVTIQRWVDATGGTPQLMEVLSDLGNHEENS